MWVKICGTTTLEDAQLAVDSGADAVGFVFAESKRKVLPEEVAPITAALPANVERVGVFHSLHTVAEIIASTRQAGLSAVQIHQPYAAETTETLRRELGPETKLLQVVTCSVEGVNEQAFLSEMKASLADPNLWGILLDAARAGVSGGTGERFDWARVAALLDEVWPDRHAGSGKMLVLAGGLRPENVREAILALQPSGVDVVSGVEQAPGVKDAVRVRTFVTAAASIASNSKLLA